MADYDAIKKRFEFSGHLKISVKNIENMHLSKQEFETLLGTLDTIHLKYIYLMKDRADFCCKLDLSKARALYIDYKHGKLNFFIEDIKNKTFTQNLTIEDYDILCKNERKYYERVKNIIEIGERTLEIKRDMLTQTLIHTAYKEQQHNRGSPIVQGKTIDDDFELEL